MIKIILILLLLVNFQSIYAISDQEFVDLLSEVDKETDNISKFNKFEDVIEKVDERQKFLVQFELAQLALELGMLDKAKVYAESTLKIKDKYKQENLYGSALHHAYTVLGRIELINNDIESAELFLIKSGEVSSSPDLRSFGPNMKLAKELLAAGSVKAVKKYLILCRNFWELGKEKIDLWISQIEKGCIPDFGKNIKY